VWDLAGSAAIRSVLCRSDMTNPAGAVPSSVPAVQPRKVALHRFAAAWATILAPAPGHAYTHRRASAGHRASAKGVTGSGHMAA
ncbi:MAG TPA: hypothetical protein VGI66_07025, partial [Streptosporangiaceae bacterium]